jgi:pilus assembly protein Flp/PilA
LRDTLAVSLSNSGDVEAFFSEPKIDGVTQMKMLIVAFLKDEQGLTMVEYAIAGALVSIAAVTAFTSLGTAIATQISGLVTAVNT